MIKSKKKMKNHQNIKLIIRNINSNILSKSNSKDLNEILGGRSNLILFFDYLNDNKINFELLDFKPNSYLLLRLLTLKPKYYLPITSFPAYKYSCFHFFFTLE